MKNLIIILSVVFLNSNIYAQKKGAIIEFEYSTIDYGTIEKGDNGLRVFKFTNTGDSPLIVTKVKASCDVQYQRNQINRYFLEILEKLKLNTILEELCHLKKQYLSGLMLLIQQFY